ncbi:MAG: fasciclin domain-containing protein [Ilumatobacteraceae bacterium]
MRNRHARTRLLALVALSALTFTAAACGDDDDDAAPAATDAPAASEPMTTEPMMTEPMTSDPMTTEPMTSDMAGAAMTPTGPACGSVPTSGEGSFEGMADDPAATAASNNPELSTLVAAVTAAELVDTLNGPGPFTIFAPANSAFAKIPQADLDALLADPTGALTDILTIHVVSGEAMSSADLVEAGTVEGLNGELTIAEDNDAVTVDAGGGPATVVCADVPVANGTVHIIDTVLLPAS